MKIIICFMFIIQMGILGLVITLLTNNKTNQELDFQQPQEESKNVEFILPL